LIGPNYQLNQVAQHAARTKLGVLWNRATDPRRNADARWERYLPKAFVPLVQYDGPFSMDWDPDGPKGSIDQSLRDENLANEKAHNAIFLTPASERMQYGLELTHALIGSIEALCHEHYTQFAVFYREISESVSPAPSGVVVQKVRGKFYRTSQEQMHANLQAAINGFPCLPATVTLTNWRVSEADGHLNPAANEQVMAILAKKIQAMPRQPGH
jgi:hypothetical protein